ncbi:MAG: deoxyribodipyrimidine photolyase, partial [Gammaproteobacteria bacterium]
MPPLVVFWFRRDLRLQDNHGLSQALGAARARDFAVLPVFIFDTDILSDLPKNDARVTFIADCLADLQLTLAKQGRAFCLFHGRPTEVFAELLEKHDIRAVFCNEDYEPSAIARDRAVKQQLNARGV